MPGQEIAHCWRQDKRQREGQEAWLISQHESKIRFIQRVKHRKLMGVFSGGSHTGPGEKARRPVAPFCLICLTAPASEASDRDFGQIYVLSQRSVGKAIGKGLLTETCEVASGGQENRRKLASHAIWVPLWQPPEITVGDFNGGGGRQSCYVR